MWWEVGCIESHEHAVSRDRREILLTLTLKNMAESIAYDIAICLDDGQMTETEIAEAIEYEIAIREHEHYIYLDQEEIAEAEAIDEATKCEIAIR